MPEWLIPLGASVLLVLVASLPVRLSGRAASTLTIALLSFGVTAFAIGAVLEHAGFVEAASGRRVAKQAHRDLRRGLKQKTAKRKKNVLLLDGGSTTARGLNPKVLSQELKKRGYDVTIAQVSLAGANHFERYAMHRWLLASLAEDERERLRAANTLFLAEVHGAYDHVPLKQLDRNTDTERAYSYLFPRNAFWGWYASRIEDGKLNEFDELFDWVVFRHSLYSGLNVGALSRLVPYAGLKPKAGYDPIRRRGKRFRFKGVKHLLSSLEQTTSRSNLGWLKRVRDPRLHEIYEGLVDHFGYTTLPYLRKSMLRHNHTICSAGKEPCVEVDRALMEKLNQRALWYDSGHLTSRGADVYSQWLADELVAQQLLKR